MGTEDETSLPKSSLEMSLQGNGGIGIIERRGGEEIKGGYNNLDGISKPVKDTLVIIGSGDMSRALVMCFARTGYRVVVGSRNPMRTSARMKVLGGQTDTVPMAVDQSDIVVMAIPYEGYSSLDPQLFEGKIVIDISNRPPKYNTKEGSMAEHLQKILPGSRVVKAFNTLSSYTLQQGHAQGSKEVPVCGNDEEAVSKVKTLIRKIGLYPVDCGGLENAMMIEDMPMQFFVQWKFPGLLCLIIWLASFILIFIRRFICYNMELVPPPGSNDTSWTLEPLEELVSEYVNDATAHAAVAILACCFLPGVIASYLQLYRQTKYSFFPDWLDTWLKSRKHLGLMALLLASMHAILSIGTWLGSDEVVSQYRLSIFWLMGILSLALMAVLGVTSLPSVASSLTWAEFSFLQRYLGWWSLFFAVWHPLLYFWERFFTDQTRCIFLPSSKQIFVVFAMITIVLKLPLLLPCVYSHLMAIRRGKSKEDFKRNNSILPCANL